MDYKDYMGYEIKNIYEEETRDIKLSSKAIDNIMQSRKITLREKISNFLNKEIEISLTPAIIGLVFILGLSIFPKGFPLNEKVEIIEINGSQIIVRRTKEVSWK